MNLIEDNPKGISFFESDSKTIDEISKDILSVLDKLISNKNNSLIEPYNDLLIFIDATNGCIHSSGFNMVSSEINDDVGCNIEFYELWLESGNREEGAYYFDTIISQSVIHATETEFGKSLTLNYRLHIQNELGDVEKI